MKKSMFLALITALIVLSGCAGEKTSTSDDSAKIRQLQADKAQIVNELESTRKDLNTTIAEKDEEIARLNKENDELKTKLAGFENIIGEMINNFKKINDDMLSLREENKQLKAENARLKSSNASTSSDDTKETAQKRLDELNSIKEANTAPAQ